MDALIEEFLVETKEGLNSLDYNLVMLEQNPANKERISNIFRAIHSIKTNCSYLDLERIESLAYALEQIFYKMREENLTLTPQILSVVFEALEKIKSLVNDLECNAYDTNSHEDDLIERLHKCTVMDILEIKALFVPTEQTDNTDPAPDEVVTDITEEPEIIPETTGVPTQTPQPVINAQETIPISLDTLETLMNQTVELVQTRNQLVQIMRTANNIDVSDVLHRLNCIANTLKENIPLKSDIMPILQVRVNNHMLAIPQANVIEVVRINSESGFSIETIDDKPVLQLRENILPLIPLSEIICPGQISAAKYIIACEVGDYEFGVIIDQVFDIEEIVVNPIPPTLEARDIYSGATTIGDSNIILILDMDTIAHKTEGFAPVRKKLDDPNQATEIARFVIFDTGDSCPKIIPLALVSKLVEIDVSNIDYSGNNPVIKYNDSLVRLVQINDEYQIPKDGNQHILVISREDQTIGLLVKEVLNMVKCPVNNELTSHKKGCLGLMTVNGKISDLIDVNYYFDKTCDKKDESKKKILFVDDSAFFRKFLPRELISAGYSVVTCASAKEALAKLEGGTKFDVVVTDIHMPDMDGNEFTRLCKQNPLWQNIPFLALYQDSTEFASTAAKFSASASKTNKNELVEALKGVFATEEAL